jgi:hypothetical protein
MRNPDGGGNVDDDDDDDGVGKLKDAKAFPNDSV